MKKSLIMTVVLFFLFTMFGEFQISIVAAKEFTIRFGGTQPEGHPFTRAQYKFKELVEQKSKGRIEVGVFPASQLGGNTAMNEAVQQGTLTMTFSSLTYAGSNFENKYNVFNLPFIISQGNLEKASETIDGSLMQNINNAMGKKGFKVIGYAHLGFRHITNSKRPIEKPSDLTGIKIRLQPNELHMQTFRMLGANPTAMDWAEVFSAMQQRVIDGQENPLDIIYTNKFYEVQKYLSLTGHFFDFAGFWMNQKFFDQLPVDLQKVVTESGTESIKYQRNLTKETTGEYLQKLRGAMQVNEIKPQNLQEFQEKVSSIYKDYLSKTADKGFAQEILNALGVKY